MKNEEIEVNENAVETKPEAAVKAVAVAAEEFEEYGSIEVTGNFRGFWRDVPVRDEAGNPTLDENKTPVKRRQFKISRTVKLNDKPVRQTAWLSEADAKAHKLEDGVKYNLTLSVGENLTPSKGNGRDGYLDEYAFADATIVSVNSK